ncbi:MAG: DUF2163 domain-containing protein [Pseudomonadota bacterium]
MRTLPASLAAALASGTTTLARAWTLTRRDGQSLCFTDHDRALTFEGVTHEPASGFTAAAIEQATGLGIDSHAIEGALRSEAITALDLERGLYDGARVRRWLVDWSAPDNRVLLAEGTIAEIRRGEHAFEAEIAGLAEGLNRPQGRVFSRICPHSLGDGRCGVDLNNPALAGVGAVTAVLSPERFLTSSLDAFATGFFTRGRLTWQSGANLGPPSRVLSHRTTADGVEIALRRAPALPITPGETFALTAGCDKRFATCQARFANQANFGGFPHLPGDDWAIGYPNTGDGHDGGSLYRS